MSVAVVASRTSNTLVILDVLLGHVARGLRVAVALVPVGTSFALFILDVFGHGAGETYSTSFATLRGRVIYTLPGRYKLC